MATNDSASSTSASWLLLSNYKTVSKASCFQECGDRTLHTDWTLWLPYPTGMFLSCAAVAPRHGDEAASLPGHLPESLAAHRRVVAHLGPHWWRKAAACGEPWDLLAQADVLRSLIKGRSKAFYSSCSLSVLVLCRTWACRPCSLIAAREFIKRREADGRA